MNDNIFENMRVSIHQQTKTGQQISGDNYFIHDTKAYSLVTVVDGLGSGPHARNAADKAIEVYTKYHHLDILQIMHKCNEALRGSRGAVTGCLRIEHTERVATFVGIGNIQCFLLTPQREIVRAISRPGYLNGRPISAVRQQFKIEENTVFLMFSDGLELNRALLKQLVGIDKPDSLLTRISENLDNKDDLTVLAGQYLPTT